MATENGERMVGGKGTEMSQALDEKYLGRAYPGTARERLIFLEDLEDFLKEEGEDWVRENRGRLLLEAQFIVDQNIL